MADAYHFNTRFGTFWIRPQPGSPGRWLLGLDEESLGSYASPELAADDVYMQATGHLEWDISESPVDAPADLGEWERDIPDI